MNCLIFDFKCYLLTDLHHLSALVDHEARYSGEKSYDLQSCPILPINAPKQAFASLSRLSLVFDLSHHGFARGNSH